MEHYLIQPMFVMEMVLVFLQKLVFVQMDIMDNIVQILVVMVQLVAIITELAFHLIIAVANTAIKETYVT